MRIGFSGTRRGMTPPQSSGVALLLERLRAEWLHHGDCIGGDAEVHAIARELGIKVWLYPPDDPRLRAFCVADVTNPAAPYVLRNHDIVDDTRALIAAPLTYLEYARSGTWATVRYARKQRKPLAVVLPDGTCHFDFGVGDLMR